MTRLNTFKLTIAALGLVAGGFVATTAQAGGFSFSVGFGGDGGMLDNGVTIGDPMGYPLIGDGVEVTIPLGPTTPLVIVDKRAERQHAHDCRMLKEAEAELKLVRKHWNKAFFEYERGQNRNDALRMDEEALKYWGGLVAEYKKRCYGD